MAHSIITVATMKGGSGKSTLASCLAVHWQLNGRRSAIIDADPQSTIARLAAREKALGGVPVIKDATDDAFKQAQRLVGDYDTVIIDTPGFRSQGDAGLPRRDRFRAGSGQALAVRRRSHAGHAERPHQRRQRTAADRSAASSPRRRATPSSPSTSAPSSRKPASRCSTAR